MPGSQVYRYDDALRQEVYERLVRGQVCEKIAADLGVSGQSVARWARLAGMKLRKGRRGGVLIAETPGMVDPSPTRKYRRLTLADRSFIQAARLGTDRLSMRAIAAELGIAASTVSRELRRADTTGGRYSAGAAHHSAVIARSRPRQGKLCDPWLRAAVIAGLNAKHSPMQVSSRLQLDYPNNPEKHVSHQTIYQALYVQGKGALRHELTVEKALRSGRQGRIPRSKLPRRSSRPWLEGARLAQRPAHVEDRAVPGHWEGDLVVGPGNSGVITLVERSTRFALIGRLPGARDSKTVIEVMQRMVQGLPSYLLTTLTWDQGLEMAQHRQFTVATRCAVFFCDPHSPWQRGSNENLNGLIRDFYPKGTNFNLVSDHDITTMQDLLNDRPRQTLGFYTPREKLNELITSVALAT